MSRPAPSGAAAAGRDPRVAWHDAECGGYSADLPLWERLAAEAGAAVLELGCGTGRVSLHLARRGHRVTGVDADPPLIDALAERAADEGLAVEAVPADVRRLELGRRFALVLAPMQLIHLFPTPAERAALVTVAASHLAPGGLAAFALLADDAGAEPEEPATAFPDVREREGWVFSSLPLAVRQAGDELVIERLRQAVSPGGALREERSLERLTRVAPAEVAALGRAAGLEPGGRIAVLPTNWHLGSTVVLLRAPPGHGDAPEPRAGP